MAVCRVIRKDVGVAGDDDLRDGKTDRGVGEIDDDVVFAQRFADFAGVGDVVEAIGVLRAGVEGDDVAFEEKAGAAIGDEAEHERGEEIVAVVALSPEAAEVVVEQGRDLRLAVGGLRRR